MRTILMVFWFLVGCVSAPPVDSSARDRIGTVVSNMPGSTANQIATALGLPEDQIVAAMENGKVEFDDHVLLVQDDYVAHIAEHRVRVLRKQDMTIVEDTILKNGLPVSGLADGYSWDLSTATIKHKGSIIPSYRVEISDRTYLIPKETVKVKWRGADYQVRLADKMLIIDISNDESHQQLKCVPKWFKYPAILPRFIPENECTVAIDLKFGDNSWEGYVYTKDRNYLYYSIDKVRYIQELDHVGNSYTIKSLDENGNTSKWETTKDGKCRGKYNQLDKDGNRIGVGVCKDGELSEYFEYENGVLKSQTLWQKDKKFVVEFYSTDKVMSKELFDSSGKSLIYEKYFENGKLEYRKSAVDMLEYYESGKPKMQCISGKCVRWDVNGERM